MLPSVYPRLEVREPASEYAGPVSVHVRLFAAARAAAGVAEVEAESGTLTNVQDELVERYPDLAGVLPRCSFLVDGVAVHRHDAQAIIEPGSEVDVLPPFAGG